MWSDTIDSPYVPRTCGVISNGYSAVVVVGESDLLLKCSSLIHSELKGLELSMETMETLRTLWTLENWPQLEL